MPMDTAVRGRPVSAQKRKPSVTGLLGSIPEVGQTRVASYEF